MSRIFTTATMLVAILVGTSLAGDRKGKAVTVAADPKPEPLPPNALLFTRGARTEPGVTLRSTFAYFTGVELEEARDLEGFGVNAELIVPLGERWQVSLQAPIYLDGEAELRQTGADVDIDGWGGTFDFPSLRLDWWARQREKHGYDLALSLGAGYVFSGTWGELDTDIGDTFNHSGTQLSFGLAFDRPLGDSALLLANAGVRHYLKSDDLIPGKGSAATLADLSVAVVFWPSSKGIHPAVEVDYLGNFGDFDALTLAPEVIVPIGGRASLTLGAVFGLTEDAEDLGGRAQLSWRF